ncbi:hypothetical protein [Elizabethkingia anophelis]|jgi:hypothetical protein|uniref:hypothetical protein n=1 Tax=Elizabethkingia anophelis TaxID=1117645 RepID=UPI0021A94F23|nr:hypothetical protein [Elizabethkingia anophelis]MDV4070004.1 hypothetical protein [Elizabethkingia anophelis]
MEKKMPIINIQGTDFLVDIDKLELREKANENNKLVFEDWQEKDNGYGFYYDTSLKNIPHDPVYRNDTTSYVIIPEFVVMAPVEMSKKYRVPLDEITKMSDFDVMVNQKALDMRVNKGMLPTIDIEGHTFYVDIRMDKLRPKDDFLSNGIVFSEMENYFNDNTETYIIPYNPQKKELAAIDYETITEIPKNFVVVEIPSELKMDPIGWNRLHGFDFLDDIKKSGLKMNFTARPCKWEDIYVPQKIMENLGQLDKSKKGNLQDKPDQTTQNEQRRKGRKL